MEGWKRKPPPTLCRWGAEKRDIEKSEPSRSHHGLSNANPMPRKRKAPTDQSSSQGQWGQARGHHESPGQPDLHNAWKQISQNQERLSMKNAEPVTPHLLSLNQDIVA